MHRRAATLKNFQRPSTGGPAANESSILRESPEDSMMEDSIRKKLIDTERENDRLRAQIQSLQHQLSQRPSKETIAELEKEYNNLELILQGTQKENEKCMRELDIAKAREKQLEKEIEKIAGENWRENLEVSPAPNPFAARSAAIARGQAASTSNTSLTSIPISPSGNPADAAAQIEQVRLLILGMEQRLQTREEKLNKSVERAEHEGRKFQEIRKELHLMGTP